jgi:hypothetical protein
MTALPYHNLPACPDQITAPAIIARFLDGLGFRYRWATEGLTESDLQFRPVEGSMDMMEVLGHIYRIAVSADHFFDGKKTTEKPETFPDMRKHTLRHIADLSERLKTIESAKLGEFKMTGRKEMEEIPFWYLLNGHIADALTHVGQILSWRRINGNPQPKGVNVFFGTAPTG